MAPHTKSAPLAPRTPKKPIQSDRVKEVVDKLNREYNLAVEIPDVTLTPASTRQRARQDAAFARSEKIIRGIRFHSFQTTLLDRILRSFHMEARAASQNWIRPFDDDEPVPESGGAPKAETSGQVLELQEVLISVLDMAHPRAKASALTYAQTGAAAFASPDPCKSKRRSETDTTVESPKRVKASLHHGDGTEREGAVLNALDKVPSRSRSAKPVAMPAQFTRDASRPHKSFGVPPSVRGNIYGSVSVTTSASTSRTSLFSRADEQLPGTQETIPAPIEEEEMRRPLLDQETNSSQSQDLFPASSGHLDALNISFTEHEVDTSTKNSRRPADLAPEPFGSTSNWAAVNSGVSGLRDPSLCQPLFTPLKRSEPVDLRSRLDASWPRFPSWLNRAPFAVAWEITRIAVHCGIDLGEVVMDYDETWINYNQIWKALLAHPLFAGKSFPERPSTDAWAAAMSGFNTIRGQHVVFSARFVQVPRAKKGPIFSLSMQPIALDQGCRLHRKFGSDRFLEILIPSPKGWQEPINNPKVSEEVIRWFSSERHYLAGRQWRAYFSKDAGHKTPQKHLNLGPEPKPVYQDRLYLFAENGNNFHEALPHENPRDLRDHKLQTWQMLDWLLQFNDNKTQPFLKLFSRIQLGLSKTTPVIVLDPKQIIHREKDLRSQTSGKVMNDGIGLMSRSLARKVRDVLGLSDIPSAIQGRLGSAKGMWEIDVSDNDDGLDGLWIDTWPSQRKWECDFSLDEYRTLEISAHSMEPRSASLNIQFLPVLEDRAIDKAAMRESIGNIFVEELNRELEGQKNAMKHPLEFRKWNAENSSTRKQRLTHGRVPFLAGLPVEREETMNFLLDGGFEPQKQKFLQDIAWNLRRSLCESLKKKMSIKIPNSTYVFMVVDHFNQLEEGEVHLSFSSKFQTETFSGSMLHGCDVLVARSPAHYVSDMQRVKAVFKPELHPEKNIIVFSAKGDVPLADKLSGGDYDGDKAWVCWEPAIVSNFKNAEVPPSPNLSSYLRIDKTTFGDLVQQQDKGQDKGQDKEKDKEEEKRLAISDMITRSIAFSMKPSYLGIATNYKERLCYHINSVNNEYACRLSALLGNLVDQAKQGFEFTADDWNRFCRVELDSHKYNGKLEEPAYKSENWSVKGKPVHIIDHLKFLVAKPAIDRELEKFHNAMNTTSGRSGHGLRPLRLKNDGEEELTAELWDPDLAKPYEAFEKLAATNPSLKKVLRNLKNDLEDAGKRWDKGVAPIKDKDDMNRGILEVYELWRTIQPRPNAALEPMAEALLRQTYAGEDHTNWALLRASTTFKIFYRRKSNFAWRMAGIQLQFIKAMTTAGPGSVLVPVAPSMYAAMKPDAKFITQAVSKLKDEGSEYPGLDSDGENHWQGSEGEE
ncbi:RNA-directed RNA polymerase [Colletotrichum orchidophilum]|uniref:RNA-dependent RNA polymerase n=1 Tax=Colletotrichum orchidophilum TaxID=1209926 RepID=A0A1G4APA0_9PEZI|nr:RNA-directed RNA polymerase [Colletotrichum orchidophilum]OHE90883.1 RNA-directed RNA polymerase [Colletotrichum orchidophilum]